MVRIESKGCLLRVRVRPVRRYRLLHCGREPRPRRRRVRTPSWRATSPAERPPASSKVRAATARQRHANTRIIGGAACAPPLFCIRSGLPKACTAWRRGSHYSTKPGPHSRPAPLYLSPSVLLVVSTVFLHDACLGSIVFFY